MAGEYPFFGLLRFNVDNFYSPVFKTGNFSNISEP